MSDNIGNENEDDNDNKSFLACRCQGFIMKLQSSRFHKHSLE